MRIPQNINNISEQFTAFQHKTCFSVASAGKIMASVLCINYNNKCDQRNNVILLFCLEENINRKILRLRKESLIDKLLREISFRGISSTGSLCRKYEGHKISYSNFE